MDVTMRHLARRIFGCLAKVLPVNSWRIACQRAKGARIGERVYLASDVNIELAYPELVEIHDQARFGIGVVILAPPRRPVATATRRATRPGHYWPRCRPLRGGHCDAGRHRRPGAVVEDDVPPFTYVGGVPARLVSRLGDPGTIKPVS